ncbi:SH3 domain-containing protein [Roseicella aquatilis]|uniref:SH3 domain-containing protein n=1 Tax=Roseicella aquatilis TaxID=2527868 RepID=A0A4R4DRB3_9PROT|nr:SH3 domain-containing protein [Roseicella aquatilis]TCZ64907.1 SH3 domain-containing protein [Roseicella aquatilis]
MRKLIVPLVALVATGVSACDDAPKQKPDPAPALAAARQAAEAQVRARLRMVGEMQTRAVQAWRQQLPDTVAVCGQVNPTGEANDPFIPWVATVTLKEGRAERAELVIGMSNAEATRVFVEMLDRCFEGGGPPTGRPQARAVPPLPLDASIPPQRPAPQPPAPPPGAPEPPAPVAAAATGRAVTTTAAHPVNIRNQPGGGGAVVRIVPRASTLRVFGEAPGGWLQVGEDQPFGWVHGSMIDR